MSINKIEDIQSCESLVLKILEEHHHGFCQTDIAHEVGVSDVTMAKRLDVMVAKGLIIQRNVGVVKLFYLPKYYQPEVEG